MTTISGTDALYTTPRSLATKTGSDFRNNNVDIHKNANVARENQVTK